MSINLLTWFTTFIIIILAELGDKTQMAVLLITSRNPDYRWAIYLGSALALISCVALEVTIGVTLAGYLAPSTINHIAGVFFTAMGILALVKTLRENTNTVLEN